ncbi:777_t:CDS:2, partial [Entrophospora sp. SA101]
MSIFQYKGPDRNVIRNFSRHLLNSLQYQKCGHEIAVKKIFTYKAEQIFKLISPGISDSNLENDPGIGHRKRSRYNHNESLATEAL